MTKKPSFVVARREFGRRRVPYPFLIGGIFALEILSFLPHKVENLALRVLSLTLRRLK